MGDVKNGKMAIARLEKPLKKLKRDFTKNGNCDNAKETTYKNSNKASLNQVKNFTLKSNGEIGSFDESTKKCVSAKVKSSKSMIVCCVCLKIVHSQEDMDSHWEIVHHISK